MNVLLGFYCFQNVFAEQTASDGEPRKQYWMERILQQKSNNKALLTVCVK